MPYRPEIAKTLDRFGAAWNEADVDRRWSLVHACAAPDVVYLDPHSDRAVRGQAALAAFVGTFRERVGWSFAWAGAPDAHHGWCRAPFRLFDGEAVRATGLTVASLDDLNRLVHVVHFLDG